MTAAAKARSGKSVSTADAVMTTTKPAADEADPRGSTEGAPSREEATPSKEEAAREEAAALAKPQGGLRLDEAVESRAVPPADKEKERQEDAPQMDELVAKAFRQSEDFDARWQAFKDRFQKATDNLINSFATGLGVQPAAARVSPITISEARVAQILHRASKLVVLTGAGISAESGIPTFRGSDGYWTVGSQNYQPQELATWEKYNEMPEELWRWYRYRWGICRKAKPNPGHRALVELEKLVKGGLDLVTQNIDGLHLDAGSNRARLCEIHGRIDEMRCDEKLPGACSHGAALGVDDVDGMARARATLCKMPPAAKREEDEKLPYCKKCGMRMRPKVLWFDECYNEAFYRSDTAKRATEACDVLLIIGTQLTTGMPQNMVATARRTGATIIRIDPIIDAKESGGMQVLCGKSGEVMPRIVRELKELGREPALAPLRKEPPAPMARAPSRSPSPSAPAPGRSPSRSPSPSPPAPGAARRALSKTRASATAPAGRSATLMPSGGGRQAAAALRPRQQVDAPVMGIFLYGKLRPEVKLGELDQEEAQAQLLPGWVVEEAELPGASLYDDDGRAAACLEKTRCSVHGSLLTPRDPEKAAEVLRQKMAEAEQEENSAELFQCSVVSVRTSSGASRLAYVYHRLSTFKRSRSKRIEDGVWRTGPKRDA